MYNKENVNKLIKAAKEMVLAWGAVVPGELPTVEEEQRIDDASENLYANILNFDVDF